MSVYKMKSLVDPQQTVEIDPYGANPIAAEFEAINPVLYGSQVRTVGPPPKLFMNGEADFPPFTASGFDPQLLLTLPYRSRHALAAEPSIAVARRLFEDIAGNVDAWHHHPGLDDAVGRVRTWIRTVPKAAPMTPAQEDELYQAVFGKNPQGPTGRTYAVPPKVN